MEIQQPKERPDSHEHISFRRECVVGKSTREEQEYCEGNQNEEADSADYPILFDAFLSRSLKYRDGHKAVDDGGTDCGGIHDPADRRPSEKRDGQRDQQHQKYGIDRDLFLIELGKAFGQNTVLRHGIAETAQGTQHADQAGKNQ